MARYAHTLRRGAAPPNDLTIRMEGMDMGDAPVTKPGGKRSVADGGEQRGPAPVAEGGRLHERTKWQDILVVTPGTARALMLDRAFQLTGGTSSPTRR